MIRAITEDRSTNDCIERPGRRSGIFSDHRVLIDSMLQEQINLRILCCQLILKGTITCHLMG